MNKTWLLDTFKRIKTRLPACAPQLGIILGSGWAESISSFQITHSIPIIQKRASIQGHPNRVVLTHHAGCDVLIFVGRRHWYEGLGWDSVALPIFILKQFGAKAVLLTNAAGGVNRRWDPGDLMIIDDHINAMGVNPLNGPHDPLWGPRFPDMSAVYDKALHAAMTSAGRRTHIKMHHGIYMAFSGPSYETPAEIVAARRAGADAVGMSTVPEAILAHAAGLRVTGLSLISNPAAGVRKSRLSHEEVLQTSRQALPCLQRLLPAFVECAAPVLASRQE